MLYYLTPSYFTPGSFFILVDTTSSMTSSNSIVLFKHILDTWQIDWQIGELAGLCDCPVEGEEEGTRRPTSSIKTALISWSSSTFRSESPLVIIYFPKRVSTGHHLLSEVSLCVWPLTFISGVHIHALQSTQEETNDLMTSNKKKPQELRMYLNFGIFRSSKWKALINVHQVQIFNLQQLASSMDFIRSLASLVPKYTNVLQEGDAFKHFQMGRRW